MHAAARRGEVTSEDLARHREAIMQGVQEQGLFLAQCEAVAVASIAIPRLLWNTGGGVAPQQYPKTIPPSAGKGSRGNSGQAAPEALYGPNGNRNVQFQTSLGGRIPDYVVQQGGRIYAHESNVQAGSVRAGSFKIREALKDGELKRTVPGYTPIWHFWDGGPTPQLANVLKQQGINYIVYNR